MCEENFLFVWRANGGKRNSVIFKRAICVYDEREDQTSFTRHNQRSKIVVVFIFVRSWPLQSQSRIKHHFHLQDEEALVSTVLILIESPILDSLHRHFYCVIREQRIRARVEQVDLTER